MYYKANSFNFFKGKTLTLVLAGLRGMSISSPGRNGFGTFFLAGLAGRVAHFILSSPGSVNSPTARFLICRSIKLSNSSRTATTSFLLTFALFEISLRISVLVYFFCIAGAFLVEADLLANALFFGVFFTAMPNLF